MPITIDGGGSISGLTATGISAVQNLPAGSVLQVVYATYGVQLSNNTNTFSDTGLTATITPKFSNSRILCIVDQNGTYKGSGNTTTQLRLVRNSTTIITWETYAGNTSTAAENGIGTSGCTYLDSPATTSATTYKAQFASSANAPTAIVQALSSVSTITLMEIAG